MLTKAVQLFMMWLTFLLISLSGETLVQGAVPAEAQRAFAEYKKGKPLDTDLRNLDMEFSNVNLRQGDSNDSCHDSEECLKLKGHCMERKSAGQCEVTFENCTPFKKCTCCASCDTDESECKKRQGTCRRTCEESEFYAWKFSCTYKDCRCCKDKCPKSCGANRDGMCQHTTEKCPPGYYHDSTESCRGDSPEYRSECKCCLPCNVSEKCAKYEGICEGREKTCPRNYYDLYYQPHWPDFCAEPHCKCRCCAKVLPPISTNATNERDNCSQTARDVAVQMVKARDVADEDEDFLDHFEHDDY